MFEAAELGRKVPKKDFDAVADSLRLELLELQQALRTSPSQVIVVFAGVHGAGKNESINLLNEWMDPRWIVTRAYNEPSDEERERPPFWRYWRDLPPKGQIGLFLSSWYSEPVLERAYGRIGIPELDERLARIAAFEKTLADDGALILKFWMHLSKKEQKKRLKSLEDDPLQRWRVTKLDWKHWKMSEKFVAAAERTIRQTSTGEAPWTIVEGTDAPYRSLTVLTRIRDAVRGHLEKQDAVRKAAEALRKAKKAPATHAKAAEKARITAAEAGAAAEEGIPAGMPAEIALNQRTVLDSLDMDLALKKKEYNKRLQEGRARLNSLFRKAKARGVSSVLVFEGWDAAGKGGAVRRMSAALNARDYRVIPVAAPTDEERAQHYLWRFWRHLSRAGRLTVFDRSWYGRVLVERVEGFASEGEWMRAYAEINDFEEQLVEFGIIVSKYWIHITKDEQLKRFKAREEIPYKRWKLTDEDWRNREKWDLYEAAVNDMVERTSTTPAPWTLVEGNDKRHARVKVIETYADRLEEALR